MIKFLILFFFGLAIIPFAPYAYNKYTEWDVQTIEYDSSPVNNLLDSWTPGLTAAAAKQAMEINTNTLIIDTRNEDQFNREHIKNSINLPQRSLVQNVLKQIPDKSKTVFLYDDNEDYSAKVAVRYLRSIGYENSQFLQGGLNAWKNSGYETEIDLYAP